MKRDLSNTSQGEWQLLARTHSQSLMSWNRTSTSILLVLVFGLALAGCGDSGSSATTSSPVTTAAQEINVVHVSLTESDAGKTQGVDADVTTFEAGVSYHFVVENTGTRSHELMIIEPIEPGTMDMEQMDEMALYVVEEDDLGPKDIVEFDYTFGAEAIGQPLEFACYLEGHYEAGMHAGITIHG